mmetsp:Transcript_28725/g.93829  ORF Transcript_28725/g.93829 Transcript_28725/m.93829 type:complete len:284 (-) Transcript_28725:2186-3037(-)
MCHEIRHDVEASPHNVARLVAGSILVVVVLILVTGGGGSGGGGGGILLRRHRRQVHASLGVKRAPRDKVEQLKARLCRGDPEVEIDGPEPQDTVGPKSHIVDADVSKDAHLRELFTDGATCGGQGAVRDAALREGGADEAVRWAENLFVRADDFDGAVRGDEDVGARRPRHHLRARLNDAAVLDRRRLKGGPGRVGCRAAQSHSRREDALDHHCEAFERDNQLAFILNVVPQRLQNVLRLWQAADVNVRVPAPAHLVVQFEDETRSVGLLRHKSREEARECDV